MTAIKTGDKPEQQITLRNPVANSFGTYIFGNATQCDRVVTENEAKGQTLVICGAGPTLVDTAAKFIPRGDQVWGTNSAATWLYAQGYPITHGFTVDQTAHMLEEWATVPPLDYFLASSCNPNLGKMLMDKGRKVAFFNNYCGANGDYGYCGSCQQQFPASHFVEGQPDPVCPLCGKGPTRLMRVRQVAYGVCQGCQNMSDADVTLCKYCGEMRIEQGMSSYEDWLYATLYPSTIRTGAGLNATTRAIDLGLFMGFKKIYVLGADCAMKVTWWPKEPYKIGTNEHREWLTKHVIMHADGGHALASEASEITLQGEVDGVRWLSKPDMVITATWLRAMKKTLGPRLSIIGDTLVRAILNKDDEFVSRLPQMIGNDGRPWAARFEERVA